MKNTNSGSEGAAHFCHRWKSSAPKAAPLWGPKLISVCFLFLLLSLPPPFFLFNLVSAYRGQVGFIPSLSALNTQIHVCFSSQSCRALPLLHSHFPSWKPPRCGQGKWRCQEWPEMRDPKVLRNKRKQTEREFPEMWWQS